MAHLRRPGDEETNTKVYERFIELMDLAESRELKQNQVRLFCTRNFQSYNTQCFFIVQQPDYANLLAGIFALYDVRRRYAALTNRNVDAVRI